MPCRMTIFSARFRFLPGCLPQRICAWRRSTGGARSAHLCCRSCWLCFCSRTCREARPIKAPPAQGPLFAFHVTLNILAYSAFAISFVLSIIFLVQNRRLRDHKLGVVGWRFPALDVLERMTRSSVLIGCASLAAGMTAGLIWAHRLEGSIGTAIQK